MKRRLSWLVFGVGLVAPVWWARQAMAADVEAQMASRGWACGTSGLAIMLFAAILVAASSLLALGLNLWSLRSESGSASTWRRIEAAMIATPFLGGVGLLSFVFAQ